MRGKNGCGIKSFARTALRTAALGASSLALTAPLALAQERAEGVDGVTVVGQQQVVESPKYTAPLLDTPQTVTVVPRAVIEQQNLLNLRDVLSTLPGITFGAGEGGGGYGDSINLRGYSAGNDITVDGVRDSAQYSRTDPFNLEQVELTNGANSVYAGAGSVGGSINLVSKTPTSRDFTIVQGGVGTDAYGRATLDMNHQFGDGVAARLNVMAHQNDQPGRDVETYERWGVAPSITFGLDTSTQVTVAYVHQEDDNTPQYGVPYAGNAFNNGPLPGVDSSDYFGLRNLDKQNITFDSLTGTVSHEFNDNVRIRNLSRWQEVQQDTVTSAVQGSFCLDNGINPYTGAACAAPGATTPGTYLPSGPRGNVRNTDTSLLYNQTDLTMEFDTGGLSHTLVIGAAFTKEEFDLTNGSLLRNANGSTIAEPPMDLSDPSGLWTGPTNFIIGGGATSGTPPAAPSGRSHGERENQALYLFDTIELSPQWEVNGGVRVEHNEGFNEVTYYTPFGYTPSGNGNVLGTNDTVSQGGLINGTTRFENEDTLLSYRAGLVFKPVENASLYIAYGNSETPSQASVTGACSAVTCNVDPEEARNYEIGAKWDVLDGRLSLTGSIFRNERNKFRVAAAVSTLQQELDGESRVDGVALGAAGLLTEHWSIFANYTYLDSELLQSISNDAIEGGTIDFVAGDPLPNTPKHAFSLWTTYELGHGVMVGYGATYQGEFTFTRASATAPLFYTDAYWVHRAMVSWEAAENLVLQLNLNNLTDELYYERIRNNATNGWATPGPARSATLSATYRF